MLPIDLSFYKDKRVLVTGHTGFKGSWLCRILQYAGAEIIGYSLGAPTSPSLFEMAGIGNSMNSIVGDVRDFHHLYQVFCDNQPEIVFHLAAQPIVRESYEDPRYTYETNVIGTVNILECVRQMMINGKAPRSVLNVTTDKVYQNKEQKEGYREEDVLDGFDPYSNSKSCSELVTHSYIRSFLGKRIAVSTARAGNVIGGGDFARDRIIPDCIRAVEKGDKIRVRNPFSIRPYQHVLDPLAVYLMIAEKQWEDSTYAGYYNVGPDEEDCITTAELADLFCSYWGEGAAWESNEDPYAPHEANYLKLDCSKLKETFGWQPHWHIEKAIEMVCQFGKAILAGDDAGREMDLEIKAFFEG